MKFSLQYLAIAIQFQSKPRIEFATVVFSATGETRDRAADPAHPWKFLITIRTNVNKSRRETFRSEGQIVATRFIGNVEIAAGFAPFAAVRSDSSPSNSELREQMRQFVSKRAIDLVNRQSGSDTVI
jgi:hypothetical protein